MEGYMSYPVEISDTQMINLNAQPYDDMFTGDSSFSGDSPAEFTASPVESPASYDDHDVDDDDEDSVSDCESCVSSYSSSSSKSCRQRRGGTLPEGVVTEVAEDDRVHELIKLRFLSCLTGRWATVVSVHKRNWAGFTAQARLQAFRIHSRAVAEKNGGNPNVKFAWFGGSKERVHSILAHGFSHLDLQGSFKFGVGGLVLFPDNFPSQSVEDAVADEDGLKYVLLCRVLLGKAEVVEPNSNQTHPSLDEFDSGIDDSTNPKKYIVWSTNMNVHVLPEYVVTFEAPQPSSVTGSASVMVNDESHKLPTSPWISFPALIQVLGKFIPANALVLIKKFHKDYKERRISRPELIRKVRQIAGDQLLVQVIKKVYRR